MTNILLVSTYKLPSYYLAIKDFQRLENKLGVCFHFDLIRNIRDRDIAWCDIALIIRGDDPLSADFAQLVYKTKRKVYLLLDDDLLEYRSQDCDLNNKRRIKALKKIINISDCITHRLRKARLDRGLLQWRRYCADRQELSLGKTSAGRKLAILQQHLGSPIHKRKASCRLCKGRR